MIHKITDNFTVSGSLENKSTAFTAVTDATVSMVRPDIVRNPQPELCYLTLRTTPGNLVKMLGKVDVHVCPPPNARHFRQVILGTHITNDSGLVVDLRQNVLSVWQEDKV